MLVLVIEAVLKGFIFVCMFVFCFLRVSILGYILAKIFFGIFFQRKIIIPFIEFELDNSFIYGSFFL